MVTLSLLRHAKSAWTQQGLKDFDRPLAPRGRRAAPAMGRYIAQQHLEPDLVICSTAVRARETLDLAIPEFGKPPDVEYSDRLYMASPDRMLKVLHALPPDAGHAMLVGHNPGMHGLAAALAGDGEPASLMALAAKFPTAGLAVIDFECSWEKLARNSGGLRLFMVPRRLPE